LGDGAACAAGGGVTVLLAPPAGDTAETQLPDLSWPSLPGIFHTMILIAISLPAKHLIKSSSLGSAPTFRRHPPALASIAANILFALSIVAVLSLSIAVPYTLSF
jgi:hypothetical protein